MRRGLTLLELLVALALLLALAVLTLPPMLGRLERQTFVSTADTIQQQLLLARAYAQSTGRSVEVRYRADPPRIEAMHFDPSYEESAPDASVERIEMISLEGAGDAIEDERAIPEGWAEQSLPARFRIDVRPPGDATADVEMPIAGFAPGFSDPSIAVAPFRDDEAETLRMIRLAVYLTDGSAMAERPFYLHDAHGRAAKLAVNPWTGLCTIEPIEPRGESIPAEPAEDEPPPGVDDLLATSPTERAGDDRSRPDLQEPGNDPARGDVPEDEPTRAGEGSSSDDGETSATDDPRRDGKEDGAE